jgi:hypothetical protein
VSVVLTDAVILLLVSRGQLLFYIDSKRVNSKKPSHLCGKYAKPSVLREIAKIHRFYANSFQYALIVELNSLNTISDK